MSNNNSKNEIRKANIIYAKNGNGFVTTRITLPVPWTKELGFTEGDKKAIIELKDNQIIIRKEINNMLLIKEKNVKNSLGHYVDYILENDVELYSIDWNGEEYTNGYIRKEEKNTNNTYTPIYRYQLDNIDIDKLEENSNEWNYAFEIVSFEERGE